MREIKNMFVSERTAIHGHGFEIVAMLKLTQGELDAIIQASDSTIYSGQLLCSKTDAKSIIDNPVVGVTITKTANGKYTGVLVSDLIVEAGVLEYEVGVLIQGTVYVDVIEKVMNKTLQVADIADLKKQGVKFYGVKTLRV